MQVTSQVMRMLGGLLEREVTRGDPEWAAAMASLTVSEKVKIIPSKRQHKDNERDCRSIVQQLVSSKPQEVLMSTYTVERNRVTIPLPLRTKMEKLRRLNKNWSKIVFPGSLR